MRYDDLYAIRVVCVGAVIGSASAHQSSSVIGDVLHYLTSKEASYRCDILTIGAESQQLQAISSLKQEKPLVIVGTKENQSYSIASFLATNSGCTVLWFASQFSSTLPIQSLAPLIERTSYNYIMLCGANAAATNMDNVEHLVVYIETRNNVDSHVIKLFCPNTTTGYPWRTIGTWSTFWGLLTNQRKSLNSRLEEYCSHPLNNKTIAVACSNLIPMVTQDKNGQFQGVEVETIKVLAEKFSFAPAFIASLPESFVKAKNAFVENSATGRVVSGEAIFGIGGKTITLLYNRFVYLSTYIYANEYTWGSRLPRPLNEFANLTRPLHYTAWIGIGATMLCLSAAFGSFYAFYRKQYGPTFVGILVSRWDILIYPMVTIVEPRAITWFPKYSTGKLLHLLWIIFTTFIVMFYTCNLRANLISISYEMPIDTDEDIIRRNFTPYIPSTISYLRPDLWATGDFTPTPSERIIGLTAQAKNTIYNFATSTPPYIMDIVIQEGNSVFYSSRITFAYNVANQTYGFTQTRLARTNSRELACAIEMKKYAPWKRSVDKILGRLRDMGIIDKFFRDPLPSASLNSKHSLNSDSLAPLNVTQFMSTFVLMLCGSVIGVLVFVGELLVNSSRRSLVPDWEDLILND